MAKPARQTFFGRVFAVTLASSLLVCGCGQCSQDPSPVVAQATDAGPVDAGADAGPFVCGLETCDPSIELCFEVRAGVRAAVAPGCHPFPEACSLEPSCDCILANVAFDCPYQPYCEQDGDRFAFYCDLP